MHFLSQYKFYYSNYDHLVGIVWCAEVIKLECDLWASMMWIVGSRFHYNFITFITYQTLSMYGHAWLHATFSFFIWLAHPWSLLSFGDLVRNQVGPPLISQPVTNFKNRWPWLLMICVKQPWGPIPIQLKYCISMT